VSLIAFADWHLWVAAVIPIIVWNLWRRTALALIAIISVSHDLISSALWGSDTFLSCHVRNFTILAWGTITIV